MIDKIMQLYYISKNSDKKPWKLQDEVKKIAEVVSVGDDLSFTVKVNIKKENIKSAEEEALKLGAKLCSIHPFKRAFRFNRGFIAFDEKFLRISSKVDEDVLRKILETLFK